MKMLKNVGRKLKNNLCSVFTSRSRSDGTSAFKVDFKVRLTPSRHHGHQQRSSGAPRRLATAPRHLGCTPQHLLAELHRAAGRLARLLHIPRRRQTEAHAAHHPSPSLLARAVSRNGRHSDVTLDKNLSNLSKTSQKSSRYLEAKKLLVLPRFSTSPRTPELVAISSV